MSRIPRLAFKLVNQGAAEFADGVTCIHCSAAIDPKRRRCMRCLPPVERARVPPLSPVRRSLLLGFIAASVAWVGLNTVLGAPEAVVRTLRDAIVSAPIVDVSLESWVVVMEHGICNVELSLRNSSSRPLRNVRVRVDSANGIPLGSIEVDSIRPLGRMTPSYSVPCLASEDIVPGPIVADGRVLSVSRENPIQRSA